MDYSRFIGKTVSELQPSGIRKFFDIVAESPDAISLGVGEPDFDTPQEGRDLAARMIGKGATQYSANKGMIKLRKLVSEYYSTRYGIPYSPEKEIIVTVGGSEGIDLTLRATLEKGDEVLIPSPSYVSYSPCVLLAGGKPVPVPCYEENNFRVQAEDIDRLCTEKTKVLVLPYPNNPTGAILEEEDLKKIAEVCIKRDILVLSDEIYSELTYTEKGHVSIASIEGMKERTLVINGFSKAFAMTGWRLGYVCGPEPIIYCMYKIHQYVIMCAPTPSQYCGIACLESGLEDGFAAVARMKEQYDFRRRFLLSELKKAGKDCFEPQGAFYAFPSVKKFGMTGEEFANELFRKEKVAVVPGGAFGDSGKYNVRISYAYSIKDLTTALKKIKRFTENL